MFRHGGDLYMVNPAADSAVARPYAEAQFREADFSVSPSGTFAAYTAEETGRPEVFVREFPRPRGKWRVSSDGGFDARWSGDGNAVYYVAPDRGSILRTELQTEPSVVPLRQTVAWRVPRIRDWHLDPNTGRAVVTVDLERDAGSGETFEVWVVVNWFEELKERLGEGQ